MAARQPEDRPKRSWPIRLLRGFPSHRRPVRRALDHAGDRARPAIDFRGEAAEGRAGAAADRRGLVCAGRAADTDHPGRAWPGGGTCPAPWWLTAPLRVLSAMDHDAFQSRIPADLAYFAGRDLTLALYPSGLLIRGRPDVLAPAQGLVVEGVSDLDVWQTSDPRAQAIERRIARLWQAARGTRTGPPESVPAARLREIVREIEALPIAYDEWQIIYRKALQVSRALEGKPQLLAGLIHQEETMEQIRGPGAHERDETGRRAARAAGSWSARSAAGSCSSPRARWSWRARSWRAT